MELNKLVGLNDLKTLAQIGIDYSNQTGKPFANTLLTGYGGLGKSAFARAIAIATQAHYVELKPTTLTTVEKVYELMRSKDIVASLNGRYLFLFLDECHTLSRIVQESFYGLMEDGRLENGLEVARFAPFCLFGATTDMDKLNYESFVSRFQNVWHIEPYSIEDIGLMIYRKISESDLFISNEAVCMIAKTAGGIPRKAIMVTQKMIEFAVSKNISIVKSEHVIEVLKRNNISEDGLTKQHLQYLLLLKQYDAPVRPMTIKAALQTNQGTVHRIEEELFRKNLIQNLPEGRILTEIGAKRIA